MIVKDLVRPSALRALWAWRSARNSYSVSSWSVAPAAKIGRHCIIRKGCEVGADVVLGDYSYISGPRSFVQSAQIGKFCSIARQVTIGVSGHDMDAVSTHPFLYTPEHGGLRSDRRPLAQKPRPEIGHDVWIGMNCFVMRGVKIGHGAVIAANSVVTQDVPPYAVVAGSPARQIRSRFPSEIVAALLEIQWWDWPEDALRARLDFYFDPVAFVKEFS